MKRFLSVFLTVCVLFGLLGAGVSAVSGTPAAAKVTTGTANLNVRAGASTSAAVTAKLKNGTWVTLLQKSGNWYRVRYGENKTGYCHADYLAVRDGSFLTTVSAGGSNLNVRKGAGTRYGVKAKLSDGAVVAVRLHVVRGRPADKRKASKKQQRKYHHAFPRAFCRFHRFPLLLVQ